MRSGSSCSSPALTSEAATVGVMKRLLRGLALTLLALVVAVVLPVTASADDDTPSSWRIDRYDVQARTDASGTTTVTINLDFNFGSDPGHGPFVTLVERQRVADDPDVWRMVDITLGAVTSPTGAPADVLTTHEDGVLVIRIGDPDITVRGVQTYTLTYTARGLIAPGQATSGLDEFNWNAIGTGWQVPISNVSATVTGPVDVVRTACFWGSGFGLPCEAASEGPTATFSQGFLSPGEGMQVVAGFPAGTFAGAEPRYEKRYHIGNMFPLTPVTGGVAGVASVLGVVAVLARPRRAARAEVYLGLTPGVRPAPGQQAAVGRAEAAAPVAGQFTPPRDARPGELGVLLDASADNEDVTATIIDLAVRGHFRIVEDGRREWRFERLRSSDPLTPAEQHVVSTLFRGGQRQVTTRDLRDKGYHELLPGTRSRLYRRVTDELRWFRHKPELVRGLAVLGGIALMLLGVPVGLALGALAGLGLVGLAFLATGLAVLVRSNKFGRRTAEGSAVLAQAKGFELYLRTAEADQIRFEEGIDVFSRYLPYAIMFGVAERWTKIFQQLAAEGRYTPYTDWYVGPYGYFYGASFTHSMDNLSHSLTDSMRAAVASQTAATSGSSGGSGFSGGGGFGGGGGGGW